MRRDSDVGVFGDNRLWEGHGLELVLGLARSLAVLELCMRFNLVTLILGTQ